MNAFEHVDNTSRFGLAIARLLAPQAAGGETASAIRSASEIHRPFSLLNKVAITTPTRQFNAYIKQYRLKEPGKAHRTLMTDRVVRDYRTTAQLHDRLLTTPSLAVPRPLACFEDLLILVFEESPGETFHDLLARIGRGWPSRSSLQLLAEHARRCGEWLRRCHEADCSPGEYSIEEMWDYLDLRLRRLVANPQARFSEALRRQVEGFFRRLRARGDSLDRRLTLVHGDFTPGNVLVDPGIVTVLDWTMAQTGSRYHDLTHFCHQLELFGCKPVFRPAVIEQLRTAVLAGYFAGEERDSQLFSAFRVLHHATHFLGLVNAAQARLAERWYNHRVCRYHLEWIDRRTRQTHSSAA